MQRRDFLAVAGATGSMLLAGCSSDEAQQAVGTEEPSSPTPTPTPSAEEMPIEVSQTRMNYDIDMSWARVSGIVENISEYGLSYLELSVYFFDSGGTRIGSGLWNTRNVPPGQSVRFETTPASVELEPVDYDMTASWYFE